MNYEAWMWILEVKQVLTVPGVDGVMEDLSSLEQNEFHIISWKPDINASIIDVISTS